MEVEDLWKQFVASGKIADYLRFVNGTRTEAAEEIAPEQMAGSEQMAEANREEKILGVAFPAGKMPDVTVPGVAVPGEMLERQIRRQLAEDEGDGNGI